MEAGFNAQMLSLITVDILARLKKEIGKTPSIRFSSVDIHNGEYPAHTFNEVGLTFLSINASMVLAKGIINLINEKRIKAPLKLVACDAGAVPRTQSLARDILFDSQGISESLQIIYVEKKRAGAGVVKDAEIDKIEEWRAKNKNIQIKNVKVPGKPDFKNTIIAYSDDMIDTGGTAEKDLKFISSFYPNASLKIFVATHPIFSKGFGVLKRIGADAYILGNTLSWDALSDIKGVEVVDFAEAIYRFIQNHDNINYHAHFKNRRRSRSKKNLFKNKDQT
jgi:phosphoribosylpyrophosphate synthetase